MTQVIKDKFDGGMAEDIRTHNTDECTSSYNFDYLTNPHRLIPIRDSVTETADTGAMADIQISDVGTSVIGGTTVLTAAGYESSSSTKPAFYIRSSGMNGVWSTQAVGTGTYQPATMVTYLEKAFVVASASATTFTLQRYNSAASVTTVGTTTVPAITGASYPVPRPFVHPEDNVLYFAVANVISKWDGTTYTNYTTILPSGYAVTSLTDYGSYLAISMISLNGTGKSICYLWGRDGTINTLQGQIDFGDGNLLSVTNLDNELIGLMSPKVVPAFSAVISNKIEVKIYSGGAVQTLKSIDLGTSQNYSILKLKNNGKLYFLIGFIETAAWCVAKNKEGVLTINRERNLYNGSTSAGDTFQSFRCLNAVGDYFYIGGYQNSGGYILRATSTSQTYNGSSIYKTTVNDGMILEDRYKDKQLVSLKIAYADKNNGTLTAKYGADGGTLTTVISETGTANVENIKEATAQFDSSPFLNAREYVFQVETTGGVEIKEICYYYNVLPTA